MMAVKLDSLPTMSTDTAKRNPLIHAVPSSSDGPDAKSPRRTRKPVNLSDYRGTSNARRATNAAFQNAPVPVPQSDDMRNLTLALMGVVGIVLYARGLPQAIWGAARNGTAALPYAHPSAGTGSDQGVSFADQGGTGVAPGTAGNGDVGGAIQSIFVPSNPSLTPAQVTPSAGVGFADAGGTGGIPNDAPDVPGYLRTIFSGVVTIPTGKVPMPKTRITSICVTDPTMCADPVPTPYG